MSTEIGCTSRSQNGWISSWQHPHHHSRATHSTNGRWRARISWNLSENSPEGIFQWIIENAIHGTCMRAFYAFHFVISLALTRLFCSSPQNFSQLKISFRVIRLMSIMWHAFPCGIDDVAINCVHATNYSPEHRKHYVTNRIQASERNQCFGQHVSSVPFHGFVCNTLGAVSCKQNQTKLVISLICL